MRCTNPEPPISDLKPKLKQALFTGQGLGGKQLDELRAINRKHGLSCRERSGDVTRFLDNKSVVRDLDAIRAALGDEKLTYHGLSYGTLIGQQYAEMFPHRVRALILDGVVDHTLTAREFLVGQAKGTQASFDRFVKWCKNAKTCTVREPRKTFRTLYRRAELGQLRDPDNHQKITAVQFVEETQTFLTGPEPQQIADWYRALLDQKPAPRALTRSSGLGVPSKGPMYAGIFCADWNLQIKNAAELKGHLKAMAAVAPDMKFSQLSLELVLSCQNWPTKVRNPQKPVVWKNVPPVVMLSNLTDPATPYEWAQGAARQTGARLVTSEGWGHGVIGRPEPGTCIKRMSTRYLVDLKVPAKNLRCAALEP